MRRQLLFRVAPLLSVVIALTLFGCTSDASSEGDGSPGVTVTPTVTPTEASTEPPTETPSPAPAETPAEGDPATTPTVESEAPVAPSTGVAEIDQVIELVLQQDLAALEARVRLSIEPCTNEPGAGGPPQCPEGVADGADVEVFPVASCEGEWRRPEHVRATLEQAVDASPSLYAVFEAPDQFWPPTGEYVAVFEGSLVQSPSAAGYVIAGGEVTGIWFGCLAEAAQIVPDDPNLRFLVPPP